MNFFAFSQQYALYLYVSVFLYGNIILARSSVKIVLGAPFLSQWHVRSMEILVYAKLRLRTSSLCPEFFQVSKLILRSVPTNFTPLPLASYIMLSLWHIQQWKGLASTRVWSERILHTTDHGESKSILRELIQTLQCVMGIGGEWEGNPISTVRAFPETVPRHYGLLGLLLVHQQFLPVHVTWRWSSNDHTFLCKGFGCSYYHLKECTCQLLLAIHLENQ